LYPKKNRGSYYIMKKAFQKNDEEGYIVKLEQLGAKRSAALKNEQYLVRKKKTIDYLIQKGYESGLVYNFFN